MKLTTITDNHAARELDKASPTTISVQPVPMKYLPFPVISSTLGSDKASVTAKYPPHIPGLLKVPVAGKTS